MAKALLKRDIPASDKTASLESYQLYGRVAESRPQHGKATVNAYWRLYDAKGRTVGEHSAKLEAPAGEWASASAEPIEKLAGLGLAGIERAPHDTAAEEAMFFSYRRACQRGETDYGRGLAAIALAE